MSETTVALIVGSVLALIGIGVAVLAVPNHPDRAKVAKGIFWIASAVFVVAGFYWTVQTNRGLFFRSTVDVVGGWLVLNGLIMGLRFADRSSLGDLALPTSALVHEPLVPRDKKSIALNLILIY
jgi:hypothetical protein